MQGESKEGISSSKSSYDEVDGDFTKLEANPRPAHLPLIRYASECLSTGFKETVVDVRKCALMTTVEELTTHKPKKLSIDPSAKVSRTLDFSSVNFAAPGHKGALREPILSPFSPGISNACGPNKLMSLSPISSFPFRHNELASPDSPMALSGFQNTLPKEKTVQNPIRSPAMNSDHIVVPQPNDFNNNNNNNNNNTYFQSATSFHMQPDLEKDVNTVCSRQEFLKQFEHAQTNQPFLTKIWRPIPQMASQYSTVNEKQDVPRHKTVAGDEGGAKCTEISRTDQSVYDARVGTSGGLLVDASRHIIRVSVV